LISHLLLKVTINLDKH